MTKMLSAKQLWLLFDKYEWKVDNAVIFEGSDGNDYISCTVHRARSGTVAKASSK